MDNVCSHSFYVKLQELFRYLYIFQKQQESLEKLVRKTEKNNLPPNSHSDREWPTPSQIKHTAAPELHVNFQGSAKSTSGIPPKHTL